MASFDHSPPLIALRTTARLTISSFLIKLFTNGKYLKWRLSMVISTKKVIILALLGLSCLGAYPIYRTLKIGQNGPKTAILAQSKEDTPQSAQEICNNGISVSQALTEELSQEHSRLLSNIQKAFNIPETEWQETLAMIAQIKAEDTLLQPSTASENKSDHPMVKRAKSLLTQMGINTQKVRVYLTNNPNSMTSAAAGQGYKDGVLHEIEINEPTFATKTSDEQDTIIRHESRHLYYYDSLEKAYIQKLLEKHGNNSDVYWNNPAFQEYCKFHEFRADLTAAVTNIETAQKFEKWLQGYVMAYPEFQEMASSPSHPTDKERLAAVNNLISYLKAEQSILVA